MTKEQIKQKAEAEADKVVIGSGMDRASVIHSKHLLVTMYMQGATEATKELEKENDYQKQARSIAENAVVDLTRENAELNNFIMQSKKDGISPINALIIKNLGNQLTKAKEIIDTFVNWKKGEGGYDLSKDFLYYAEQFIKEVEK